MRSWWSLTPLTLPEKPEMQHPRWHMQPSNVTTRGRSLPYETQQLTSDVFSAKIVAKLRKVALREQEDLSYHWTFVASEGWSAYSRCIQSCSWRTTLLRLKLKGNIFYSIVYANSNKSQSVLCGSNWLTVGDEYLISCLWHWTFHHRRAHPI